MEIRPRPPIPPVWLICSSPLDLIAEATVMSGSDLGMMAGTHAGQIVFMVVVTVTVDVIHDSGRCDPCWRLCLAHHTQWLPTQLHLPDPSPPGAAGIHGPLLLSLLGCTLALVIRVPGAS